jgi:hypothetical protein
MKASYLMFFEYLGMIGVPVLLLLLALSALLFPDALLQKVLLALIAAGSAAYGAVGFREVYFHGGKKRETTLRQGH